jgi:hypothetical protein
VNELAAILLNRGQPPQKNDPILKKLKKKPLFLRFFRAGLKQNAYPIALSTVEKTISLKI